MTIRPLGEGEWDAVAKLIHRSTNHWYREHLGREIFAGGWRDCRVFPEVYEALDPGCCLVAVDGRGRLAASCFCHPRETHVALGIMNVALEFAGRGVARRLLSEAVRGAGALPVRLVSSAMNLDSYSLYTRAGFAPFDVYQDMWFPEGVAAGAAGNWELPAVRDGRAADAPAMAALEERQCGIRRGKDFRHFLANERGWWSVSVCPAADGGLDGFLAAIDHPGCRMLGPGVARDDATALALILAELRRARGRGGAPVFLVPARCWRLVNRLYRLGARNCELHLAQARGTVQRPDGVVMPSFLPESG